MKYLIGFLWTFTYLFLHATTSMAQNLVPNPSFEEYSSCPWEQSQIHYATGWFSAGATPDYFNSCENEGWGLSVPSSNFGYQYAHSGNAYADVTTFGIDVPNAREVITCKLSDVLTIGKKYFFSMQVSLMDNPTANCGTDNLGVLFSTVSYAMDTIDYDNIPVGVFPINFAHIYTNAIILDTTNWTEVSGSFIADSAYEYISIGNLFDDAHTTYQKINTSTSYCVARYFLDDVYVGTDSLVSIENRRKSDKLEIYPNPVIGTSEIKITGIRNYPSILRIVSIGGATVYSSTLNHIDDTINLSGLRSGTYVICVETNKTVMHKKLVID